MMKPLRRLGTEFRQVMAAKLAAQCRPVLAIGVVLIAGCAGLEHSPRQRPPEPVPAEAVVAIEPRGTSAGTTAAAAPSSTAGADATGSVLVTRPAEPAGVGYTGASPAVPPLPAPQAPPKITAAPLPAAAAPLKTPPSVPPVVKPRAPPPLDLKSLETRLKETKAIGVFSKLALKNQIDDLLDRFRDFYGGRIKTSLAELRRSFDMLVMKTLALLQDADPPLAGALSSSRESIWGILSDPVKFAKV